MTRIDGLAITHDVIPAGLTAWSPEQDVSIETLLASCCRDKASVKPLVADAILEVALVVGGNIDFEFYNAAGHICGLRIGGLHVFHISDAGWFGTLLPGVATQAVRARVVDGGPNPSATGKDCARPSRLHAVRAILIASLVLQ